MNLRKIAQAGALALTLAAAGTAGAADYELNIFGASAQYTFWNALSPSFLTSTYSCSTTSQAQSADKKHGITQASGCTVQGSGSHTMIIRYSSKASFDGIYSVKGNANVTDSCGNTQRAMADESTISGSTVGGTKCVTVSLGASDVSGVSFTQQSHGKLLGPNGGAQTDRSFTLSTLDTTGLTNHRPIVVPFGFFANKLVTVRTCTAGDQPGQQCSQDSECIGGGAGSCGRGDAAQLHRVRVPRRPT